MLLETRYTLLGKGESRITRINKVTMRSNLAVCSSAAPVVFRPSERINDHEDNLVKRRAGNIFTTEACLPWNERFVWEESYGENADGYGYQEICNDHRSDRLPQTHGIKRSAHTSLQSLATLSLCSLARTRHCMTLCAQEAKSLVERGIRTPFLE